MSPSATRSLQPVERRTAKFMISFECFGYDVGQKCVLISGKLAWLMACLSLPMLALLPGHYDYRVEAQHGCTTGTAWIECTCVGLNHSDVITVGISENGVCSLWFHATPIADSLANEAMFP